MLLCICSQHFSATFKTSPLKYGERASRLYAMHVIGSDRVSESISQCLDMPSIMAYSMEEVHVHRDLVSFSDPILKEGKDLGILSILLVLSIITRLYACLYKSMQIVTWLLSLQNQESALISPDPFLACVVGSGNEISGDRGKDGYNFQSWTAKEMLKLT